MVYEPHRIFHACDFRLHRTPQSTTLELICGSEPRRVLLELAAAQRRLTLRYHFPKARPSALLHLPKLAPAHEWQPAHPSSEMPLDGEGLCASFTHRDMRRS
jgi:hypothetical protein